ncbi:retrovirus-related pol polyprotein from transposon TNT 1-94 [Tanacetum coccineum]
MNANMINDPLYIASSDHLGMVLTNTPFNGSNFHGWSRNVKMALGAKLNLGNCRKIWTYQLERELSRISQGSLTIASYFNKLKKCWDELQNINGLPTSDYRKLRECNYDVLEKFLLRDSNSKLIQFLMKLNDEYKSVRSHILAIDPHPTVNKAYYIVQQIEKQKQVTSHTFEPTAFFANMNNKGQSGGRKEIKGNRIDGKRFCTRCNQEGHIVDQCFEKIGYPDWYKGKKSKKQGRIAAHVNSCFDEYFSGESPFDMGNENEVAMNQNGGYDQKLVAAVCQKVVKMFRGKGLASEGNAGTSHACIWSCCTASFALLCHPNINIRIDWVADTGASVEGTMIKVQKLTLKDGVIEEVVGGGFPHYDGHGSAPDHMTPKFILFITVTYLKNPIIVHLPDGTSKTVTIVGIDLSTNQIVAIGKGSRCLYICRPTVDPAAFFDSVSELKISHINYVPCVSLDNKPYKHAALNGAHYFLIIVDDNTRATLTYLVHSKEQVLKLLVSFFASVSTHLQSQPKIVRSDNGTEIVNATCAYFFQSKGVLHQRSMTYTPQQNERVERKHRHFLDIARAIRSHANLPIRFWGDCILAATYLINKMPVKILDWKTPFERLYGKPPVYDHLRVIGCLCYAAVTKPRKDKFDDRVGHSDYVSSQYPLFGPSDFKGIPSTHIAFLANVFAIPEPTSYKQARQGFTAVLVYVNDMLIRGNSNSEILSLKASLDNKFTIKDLRLAKYFMGIEICRTQHGTYLNHRKYILDLLSDARLTGAKPATFPLPTQLKLSLDKGTPLSDESSYKILVGRLLYLTMTRPDISHVVQHLSQFVSASKDVHMQAATHLIK